MIPERRFYGFEAETVFDPQTPIDGESLLGWIARTTLENELPHMTTIMRDVGQVHRNRVVDIMRKTIDVEGLATILGQDQSTVQSMRSEDVGDGRTRYLGSLIRTSDVYTRERRFASASLAADADPFCRASWLIRTFPVCVDSWQALRTNCDCGTVQTWGTVSSLVFCEGCGEDLRDLSAAFVPEEFQQGLRFLADILFGNAANRAKALQLLPSELRLWDPGDIYELALLMARVVDPTMPNPREQIWRSDPIRLALALSTAGSLLPLWPKTPWLALESAGETRIMLPRCEPLKALHSVISQEYSPNASSKVNRALDRIREEITIDCDDPREDLIDLNDAADILCVGKSKVRAARATGHMGVHFVIRRGEILPGYDRSEIVAMAASVDWPSASIAGRQLGIPPYAVEQLCAMDEMVWAKAPYRTLRTRLRIKPQSVSDVADALRMSATSLGDLGDAVALRARLIIRAWRCVGSFA